MPKASFYLLMIMAMIFWGSSWPSSKIMVEYASAEVITFWRFFFAFLASIPLIFLLKISLRISYQAFKLLFLTALLNSIYSILFFVGLDYGSAGKGGVIVTTLTPIFAYLLVYMLYNANSQRSIKANEILGLGFGIIAGICLLDLQNFKELLLNGFFILCAIDWAILTLVCQRIRIHPLAINFYMTFLSVLFWSPLLLFNDAMLNVFSFDSRFWLMMFMVAVLSTAIGTSIYYIGIYYIGATKAASFTLLVPAIALGSSYWLLGEIPSFLTLLGGSFAIFATYLINFYKSSHFIFKRKF
ncbi:DMT family transporter [Helicobacter mesocricetorum]|uniref:DMT family transporter n=1 Tax=Helicobacter mesocricetorum TaxID=87012 RepID=UPI000CF05412|nr:DMT family transporter [Helicobacter mesocricetorum]